MNSETDSKPKFTARWHWSSGILSQVMGYAEATTLLGAVRMAGASELQQAYAKNIIGLGR
jgi:hypothetical protein